MMTTPKRRIGTWTLLAILLACPAWAQWDGGPQGVDGDAMTEFERTVRGMTDEEITEFLRLAARARLRIEREQAAAEIRQDLLYHPGEVRRAITELMDAPADTQQDNIARISRAYAAVDRGVGAAWVLFEREQYAEAAASVGDLLRGRQTTYLAAVRHWMYAESLARSDRPWDAIDAYADLLAVMPDRLSFAATSAIRIAELYDGMGRGLYAMQMYDWALRNYSLTIDDARAGELLSRLIELQALYADPMRSLTDAMQQVRRRLVDMDSGEEAQQTGERIVAVLTDLIRTIEENQSGGGGSSDSSQDQQAQGEQDGQEGEDGQGQNGQPSPAQGQAQGTTQSASPASTGGLPAGVAERFDREERRGQAAEESGDWATLPPRQREQIQQVGRRLMSERSRGIIRDYHTRLAETD